MSRSLAREDAFKLIFEMKCSDIPVSGVIDYLYSSVNKENEMWAQDFVSAASRKYISDVVIGVKEHEEEINSLIKSKLKGWTIERISKVNLSVLQLALYEIKFAEEIPYKVSVNEAVMLAKKYDSNESGAFVNGVLGSIINDITEGK